MGWTTPKDWGSETLASADMDTYLSDNTAFLKANIALETFVELTIDTGAVTKTKSLHDVDTEDDDATDDLDTINGGSEGDLLILRAEHTDRTIVIKNGTGNIDCDADITLDTTSKFAVLIYDGTSWQKLASRA